MNDGRLNTQTYLSSIILHKSFSLYLPSQSFTNGVAGYPYKSGSMFMLDKSSLTIPDLSDEELKDGYAAKKPYGEWLSTNLVKLKDIKKIEGN